MDRNWFSKDYKIIRDSVHGDILIEEQYIKIINSSEFQRLRRIRQLSVANLIFPSADHTRFSHCIGTFYVMKKIIKQISIQLDNIGIRIDERDKKVVLTAALLHDIGHGPFSHAFENLFSDNQKSHEEWTIEIIKSRKTQINSILKDTFDDKFPEDVASLIEKKIIKKPNEVNTIFYNVLSSLISSQIDADRLDYLLRDSYNTGVKFGNIDLDRIISAINITVFNGKYVVYIQEKYLSDIEEYLFSRYQMNKSVYFHPTKVEIEEIIKMIYKRVIELYSRNELDYVPEYLAKIKNNSILVNEYCDLDEPLIINDFKIWSKSNDKILAKLCLSYLNRDKFTKVKILDGEDENILRFEKDFKIMLEKRSCKNVDISECFYWINKEIKFSMYKSNKENILVLNKLGKMQDITEISNVFQKAENNIVNEYKDIFTYINYDILKQTYNQKDKEIIDEAKELVNSYDTRNHIEIENKYLLREYLFEDIDTYFKKEYGKKYEPGKEIEQVDTYYDTLSRDYYMANETIRIRKIGKKYIFTIKTPVSNGEKDIIKNQNERFEFEKEIADQNILLCSEYIKEKSLLKINIKQELIAPLIIIRNIRKKNKLKLNNTIFEIAFDSFTYFSGKDENEIFSEKQIEIELKSEYSKKIILETVCTKLEINFPNLIKTIESKLVIGIKKLEGNR